MKMEDKEDQEDACRRMQEEVNEEEREKKEEEKEGEGEMGEEDGSEGCSGKRLFWNLE